MLNAHSTTGLSGRFSTKGVKGDAALELARRKVTANAIAPGFIHAGMTATLDQSILDAVVEKVPMGELGTAGDIAAAAVFLASDAARYITGQVLAVNGGLYM